MRERRKIERKSEREKNGRFKWCAAETKKKRQNGSVALNMKSNLIGGDDGSFHQQFVLAANQGLQKGSVNS